jgi:uncharacterized protein YbjT (DUF2867 family)
VAKKRLFYLAVLGAFFVGIFAGWCIGGRRVPHNPERTGEDIADLRELGNSIDAIEQNARELTENLLGDKILVDKLIARTDQIRTIPDNLDRASAGLGEIGGKLRADSEELRSIYLEVLSRPVKYGEIP